MKSNTASALTRRIAPALLTTSILGGIAAAAPAFAQDEGAAPPASVMAEQKIRTLNVIGSQRLEPETILSYIDLRVGGEYNQAVADKALKDLYDTELFANVTIRNDNGAVIVEVLENPVVNRIILEGNKRIKDDKIVPEIKLAARQIFTRSKVRADVARIIELYKRQGRFAATVEPQMVMLDQNRVDIVFEISEGPKSKVRQINIIGNEEFSDGDLRSEMVTKQSRFWRFFSSSDTYDPDKLAFDQQKLRQFYLTEGYADFRVVSAVAELTPDKRDFIITYVVEEGDRYKFGDVSVESGIRDLDSERFSQALPMSTGDWYDAKLVEDTVESLSESAGLFGYAFADVRPQFDRSREDLTMNITFNIAESARVYVESINVNGNTLTQDKVVRREFRLTEGDAFNSIQVRRSSDRIKSLGFFQENFEIEQNPGSAPDRIVLEANVEEKPTGELSLSAGFSSLESFILQGSIRQNNFRGKGQTVGLGLNYSRYSKSANVSFSEPYVFDRNVSLGLNVYRQDFNSFNYFNNDRNTTYEKTTTGFQLRVGVPVTEYWSVIGRYTLNFDDVTISQSQYFADLDGDGQFTCEPLLAGRYLCDALGKRTTSSIGASVVYDTRDSRIRPTRGHQLTLTEDFAGLGGSVRYLRTRVNASKFWNLGSNFIASLELEGGHIIGLKDRGGEADGVDDVYLTDRFFLGNPDIRGFDIRGIGPRVIRYFYDSEGNLNLNRNQASDDAIGGKTYYRGRAELQIPLGSGASELGLRPSIFVDFGALFNITRPITTDTGPDGVDIPIRDNDGNLQYLQVTTGDDGTTSTTVVSSPVNSETGEDNDLYVNSLPGFSEVFLGDSAKPRVSVGAGVNWNSPFGPFRIDFAYALLKEEGDDTQLFSFNVGTQF